MLLSRAPAGLSQHPWWVMGKTARTLEVGVPQDERTARDDNTSHPVHATDMCTVQTIFPMIYLTRGKQ